MKSVSPSGVPSFTPAQARQAFRVVRERTDAKTGETSTETAYGVTTAPAERAGPERLLAWNRGHWQVENGNHYRRDATMGEDASRVRKGPRPPTTLPSTTSRSPSCSTAASATCPRPTCIS